MENNTKGKNNIISFAWFISFATLIIVSMIMLTTAISLKFGSLSAFSSDTESTSSYVPGESLDSRILIVYAIVFSAILGFITFLMKKRYSSNQENDFEKNSVRLFISKVAMITSGVFLFSVVVNMLYQFIGAEFIKQDIIFNALLLIISGVVFAYEFSTKKSDHPYLNFYTSTQAVSVFVVILALCSVFVNVAVVGSPVSIKQKGEDYKKVQDLINLQDEAIYFLSENQKLPADIKELKKSMISAGYDVKGYEKYDYKLTSQPVIDEENSTYTGGSFDVCATFAVEYIKAEDDSSKDVNGFDYDSKWNHEKGYKCFTYNLDPKVDALHQPDYNYSDNEYVW